MDSADGRQEGTDLMSIDDLQQVADAATPGPWNLAACNGGKCWVESPEHGGSGIATTGTMLGEPSEGDATFIATFDPECVSALLAVARAAEDLQALKDGPKDYRYYWRKPEAWKALREALSRLRGEEP